MFSVILILISIIIINGFIHKFDNTLLHRSKNELDYVFGVVWKVDDLLLILEVKR